MAHDPNNDGGSEGLDARYALILDALSNSNGEQRRKGFEALSVQIDYAIAELNRINLVVKTMAISNFQNYSIEAKKLSHSRLLNEERISIKRSNPERRVDYLTRLVAGEMDTDTFEQVK